MLESAPKGNSVVLLGDFLRPLLADVPSVKPVQTCGGNLWDVVPIVGYLTKVLLKRTNKLVFDQIQIFKYRVSHFQDISSFVLSCCICSIELITFWNFVSFTETSS